MMRSSPGSKGIVSARPAIVKHAGSTMSYAASAAFGARLQV